MADEGILVIRVKVKANPMYENPNEIGDYLIDERADYPIAKFLEAWWEEE